MSTTKPSKYRNIKCEVRGEKFDSKPEADIWLQLVARQAAGEIHGLRRQERFALHSCGSQLTGMGDVVIAIQVCEYVADFVFYDDTDSGRRIVMDAKGAKKRICPYPLKKRMMHAEYGIEIVEV